MERDEGQQRRGICHGMTSGECSKPLLRPPAQENQLSCMDRDRGSMMEARDKRNQGRAKAKAKGGTASGTTRTATPPHGSTPDLLYAMTAQR
jgi:hypothetical protein